MRCKGSIKNVMEGRQKERQKDRERREIGGWDGAELGKNIGGKRRKEWSAGTSKQQRFIQ